MKNKYLELVLKNCPRLFSAINQNEFSGNYGCLDRDFWHYKIEKDFPGSIFQTGALTLALLYKNNFPDNIYFGQKRVLELNLAAISFWTKIQHSDGSFNEWYPNERSYVATAFTSCAISEALLILGDQVPEEERKMALAALERAGEWLRKHPDRQVTNHQAGAVMALFNIYLLTGKREFKQVAKKHLKMLLAMQSSEGWFPEYGGADLGYLSLTVDFLAKYWQKTKDKKILKSLARAVDFMSYFVHPNGSFGGEYGSRGTKFLMPAGLEILKDKIPQAGYILTKLSLVDSFDERYLFFFFLGNWLESYLETKKQKNKNILKELGQQEFSKDFPEAGILVKKTKDYYMVVGYKKNGVIKIFKNKELVFSDTGWWGKLDDGRIISSQWLNQKQTGLPVKTQFCQVNQPFMGKKIILFRLFNYTLGRIGFLSQVFEWWLKRIYITSVKMAPVFLKRSLAIKDNKILIEDEISLGERVFLNMLRRTSNLCQKYTPTSAFFTPSDLFWEEGKNFAPILNKKRKIKVVRTI